MKRRVTHTEEPLNDRKKWKGEGKGSGWLVFSWFLLCLKGFDDKIVDRRNCVNLSSVLCLIIWQPFFSFQWRRRGYWHIRAMCDTPSLLRHYCVFYIPENLKMCFSISAKLQILEAWLFQDRKTIVVEKNWWRKCLGQLWWLFVQISICGTSLPICLHCIFWVLSWIEFFIYLWI